MLINEYDTMQKLIVNLPFHDDRDKKSARLEGNFLYPVFSEAEQGDQIPMVCPENSSNEKEKSECYLYLII